jgi:ribosome recycling factor
MTDEVRRETDARMSRAIEALERDLAAIRTGRASTALVERINVEYYGTATPLNQLASISVPEAHSIVIQPWDRSALGAIEKAILRSDVGLTPNVDGTVVRLTVPPLTEERRKELVKLVHKRMEEARVQGFSGLQRQLYADVTGYLVDDILVKVDRMSMAVSLEARVPFLDHEVVEYAMGIPAEWKLKAGASKWILREAFRNLLPPRVRNRGKEGFSMPMKNWLRGPLQRLLSDVLDPRRIRERGWFDTAEIGRLVDEHVNGQENHAHRLWCLMSLELSVQGLEQRAWTRSSTVRDHATAIAAAGARS